MSDEIEVRNIGIDLQDSLRDLKAYKDFRDELDKFIQKEFTEGVHYGLPYEGAPKKTILLPGSQAIARLTKTKPMFFPDTRTHEMFGKTPGIITYSCYLVPYSAIRLIAEAIQAHGIEFFEPMCKLFCLAEGRGGGWVSEKKSNKLKENTVIKMTQKRALGDAAIRVADLSDKYTQDAEELDKSDFFDNIEEKKDEVDILGEDTLSDDDISLSEVEPNPLVVEEEHDDEF
jgi:hypothetical protein